MPGLLLPAVRAGQACRYPLRGNNCPSRPAAPTSCPFPSPAHSPTSSPPTFLCVQLVRDLLQKGKKNGFNVMRTWAHTVNPQFAMQVGRAAGRASRA